MRKEKTIFAAYHRPIKVKFIDKVEGLTLSINRIAGTKFTTSKKPIQLLKEMPALKIANQSFYANAKSKLKVNSKFKVASTAEILERQAVFMKELIEENKQSIRDIAAEKWNERYKKAQAKSDSKKGSVKREIEILSEYIRSNRIILFVMLIPVALIILFIITFYLNN